MGCWWPGEQGADGRAEEDSAGQERPGRQQTRLDDPLDPYLNLYFDGWYLDWYQAWTSTVPRLVPRQCVSAWAKME
eukprot:3750589-Rhodomonas_salina.1